MPSTTESTLVDPSLNDSIFTEPDVDQGDCDDPSSAADFDLDALFNEQCDSPPDLSTKEFILELPQLPVNKRPMTPPNEFELPSKRSRMTPVCDEIRESQSLPDLLLPEDVIRGEPLDTLIPGSSSDDNTLFSTVASIQQMKERMISAHTLLTTYTALKRTSTQVGTQLKTTRTQLAEANKWRFLLADENARLRSRVSIVSKEKDLLKSAITKLHGDTNGLKKNEALRNEINEKNLEISRL